MESAKIVDEQLAPAFDTTTWLTCIPGQLLVAANCISPNIQQAIQEKIQDMYVYV
jgi:hypothetical protein